MMAVKSIKQDYVFPDYISSLMETFKEMVNFCIKIGLQENISTHIADQTDGSRGEDCCGRPPCINGARRAPG